MNEIEEQHLFQTSSNHNFIYHLTKPLKLGLTCIPKLKLIDAGAANDLPLTPLFRPGRRVDVIIGFDISSDASDKISRSILDPKEDITKRRGIKSVARDRY